MRIKLDLVSADGIRPILITAEATATIADLAATIRSGETRFPFGPDSGLTLQLVGDAGEGLSIFPPRLLVMESGLCSGQRVRVAPASPTEHQIHTGNPAPARLRVIKGSQEGRVIPLRTGPNVIGRSGECDIVFDDKQVSRRHARIIVGEHVEVVDMSSANGVILAGERVEHAVLGPRDTVGVGDTTFIVERDPTAQASPVTDTDFNRSPLVRVRYEGRKFEAPEPPKTSSKRKFPLVAMAAPLLMGSVMFLLLRNPMTLIFLALSPVIAIGTWIDSRVTAARGEKSERERFREDVAKLGQELAEALDEEHAGRRDEVLPLGSVVEAGFSLNQELWYRRPADDDYLLLHLGYGQDKSRHTFTLPARGQASAEVWQELCALQKQAEYVLDVPITVALRECGNLGLAGAVDWRTAVARSLVAQLACLHSPAELVIAAIASADSARHWHYLMWLPHVGSPHSPLPGPHLASAQGAVSSLVSLLEELVAARSQGAHADRVVLPTVVLLVEDDAPVERGRLVALAEKGPEVGVHLVWLADRHERLPAACHTYLVQEATGQFTVGYVKERRTVPLTKVEPLSEEPAVNLARALSPLQDAGAPVLDQSGIPRAVSFLTLAGLEVANDPNVTVERWQEGSLLGAQAGKRQAATLRALVGQGPQGDFTLDLRSQGPHALVGGTSGAGKSEFLQSWILGMATAHSPQRVTFLFVDYKGGSAFADCVDLPHSVGLVTDLSPHLVRRALTSLRAELRYREHLLNRKNAKDLLALEKTGDPECPPALVIVVDEFAALVQEVPDFVDGVVDVAQRGRSLGLHLILATQRPAGVIKGNLRANTALRVALRMADESDSTDVIDVADAATFDPRIPGRGAVRTGPGRISLFQTAYAGGHTTEQVAASPIEIETMMFGAGVGWEIPRPEVASQGEDDGPTDISRVVASVRQAAQLLQLPTPRKPWLPELETCLDLGSLLAEAGDVTARGRILLGVVDDPAQQAQHPVFYDPDDVGNLAVFGTSGAGKSAVLRTIAYAAAAQVHYSRTEIYAIDCGSAGLGMLAGLPVVGAVIDGQDRERVERLLGRLTELLDERTDRYSAARAGSITEYRQLTGQQAEPRLLLLIDGFAAFRDEYEMASGTAQKIFPQFARLVAEGRAVGMHVVLSAERPNAMTSAMAANVQSRLVLRQADEGAYFTLDVPRDILPGAAPGRGVFAGQDNELQIAVPGGAPSPAEQASAIDELARQLREAQVPGTAPVERLATLVRFAELPTGLPEGPVLGINSTDLAPLAFTAQGGFIIAGMPGSGRTSALKTVAQSLHRWQPDIPRYYFGPRRSELQRLGLWTKHAGEFTEMTELIGELKPLAAEGAVVEGQPGFIVVIEALGELVGTPAENPMLDLIKTMRRNGHFVVAEQETTAWGSGWPLISELRNVRHGIVMQPNPMDGDALFKAELPRLKRADYPLGRGVYVRSGKQWTVQLPLPD